MFHIFLHSSTQISGQQIGIFLPFEALPAITPTSQRGLVTFEVDTPLTNSEPCEIWLFHCHEKNAVFWDVKYIVVEVYRRFWET
jgi:hypothetical protein